MLQACVDVSKSGATLDWVSTEWLDKHEMGGDDAFPIWAPPVGKYAGFHRWKNDRAKAAGRLKVREVNLIDGGDGATIPAYAASYPATVGKLLTEVTKTLGVDIARVITGTSTPNGPTRS